MTKNASIDILPMACVGLLLVIMMIMTAPMVMTHNSTPVTVPQTHTAERKTEQDIIITLTKDDKVYLNDQPIGEADFKKESEGNPKSAAGIPNSVRVDLEDQLDELISKDPYCLVVVRADKDVFHKDVLDLIAIAKQAGATRIACATKKMKE
jgi:biopolymer transport protein ExbD